MIPERELTEPVSLTDARGRLHPDAVGWTRHPMHDTSGIGGCHGWGRNKRWEYWSVITPRHIVSLTVSSIDYVGVNEVWVFDRQTGVEHQRVAISPLARGSVLPASAGSGAASARAAELEIDIEELADGTRLAARIPGVEVTLVAARPPGQQSLGVVVPWSATRFQYTVKDVARPTTGEIRIDGVAHAVGGESGEAWAVLDHGRGRWPYDVRWNWGAGSGLVEGHRIGVQLGGQWTVGSGSTENALFVDGTLHKISEELDWQFDPADYLVPWRVRGELVDLSFEPFHDKVSRTALGVISTRTDQCFGHWSGWMTAESGEHVTVDGAVGWAEDVHNRW